MKETTDDTQAQTQFLDFFRGIQAIARGEAVPMEYWVPIPQSVTFLRSQGVTTPDQVRELIRLGVLSPEGHTLRNVSLGHRPTYEVNVLAAAHVIAAWKSLGAEERRAHLRSRNISPW